MLTDDSKYFRATFNGQFSEAKAKTVHIPDIDPQTFETYVHWMYSSEIVTDDVTPKDDKTDKNSYSGLVKLYAAADRLENTHLRNCVMTECLILSTCLIPGVATIQKAYQSTPQAAHLRRFIVDARWSRPVAQEMSWLSHNRGKLPQEFLFDYTYALTQARETAGMVSVRDKRPCDYHEHSDGVPPCP